jgi:uncharacterized protein
VILCDTGPLVALIDRRELAHQPCAEVVRSVAPPLISTWACLTEAMYLVGRKFGFPGQQTLWMLVEAGQLRIYDHRPGDWQRMRDLMTQYQSVPMDLADASLVAAAESLNTTKIFTLDEDFRIYRLADGRAFEIVP